MYKTERHFLPKNVPGREQITYVKQHAHNSGAVAHRLLDA